jgi:hypothetical protein
MTESTFTLKASRLLVVVGFALLVGLPATGLSASTSDNVSEEVEPNDFCPGRIDFELFGGTKIGRISTPSDVDCFTPRAVRPGKELRAQLTPPPGRDYDVVIIGDGDRVLASNHRGPGEKEEVRFKNETSLNKTYRLRVFSFDGSFSAEQTYTLTVDKMI